MQPKEISLSYVAFLNTYIAFVHQEYSDGTNNNSNRQTDRQGLVFNSFIRRRFSRICFTFPGHINSKQNTTITRSRFGNRVRIPHYACRTRASISNLWMFRHPTRPRFPFFVLLFPSLLTDLILMFLSPLSFLPYFIFIRILQLFFSLLLIISCLIFHIFFIPCFTFSTFNHCSFYPHALLRT